MPNPQSSDHSQTIRSMVGTNLVSVCYVIYVCCRFILTEFSLQKTTHEKFGSSYWYDVFNNLKNNAHTKVTAMVQWWHSCKLSVMIKVIG